MSLRVLIIDDDRLIRRANVRVPRDRGWLTIEAIHPGEAEAVYDLCDVVLSDLDMPEGGGERVLRESPIPVVLCSASDRAPELHRFVLAKPASADEIDAMLKRAIEARR